MAPTNIHAYYIERIGLQRCKIAYFDEGLRQREDEHPFGAKSYPRRSRLVHFTSKLFIALERYSRISTNGSSFPRGPCSGVLARWGLHYHPLHQQRGRTISSGGRRTLHSANLQWEILPWCNGCHRYVAYYYYSMRTRALPDYYRYNTLGTRNITTYVESSTYATLINCALQRPTTGTKGKMQELEEQFLDGSLQAPLWQEGAEVPEGENWKWKGIGNGYTCSSKKVYRPCNWWDTHYLGSSGWECCNA